MLLLLLSAVVVLVALADFESATAAEIAMREGALFVLMATAVEDWRTGSRSVPLATRLSTIQS
jgi:hypothetical protein